MHFLSETPGNYDFSGIFGATIYVPADVYLKYLAAWGKDPGGNGNRLAADGESDNEFVEVLCRLDENQDEMEEE